MWRVMSASRSSRSGKQTKPMSRPLEFSKADTRISKGSVSSTFQSGDLVCGRFRIARFIASGGMGELYEAIDLELQDRVALKTIRPEIAADARVNQRFRREVQLARKITHPNICRIFDLFQHQSASGEGVPPLPIVFVTMELLEGQTLAEFVTREGPLTVERALPLASQMAAALAAAHEVGIVHRDFKSNNVMILPPERPDGPPRTVVSDFGLAYQVSDTAVPSDAPISVSGEIMGTLDYMAPEQIQGGAATPATDVYALGIVLYEMVTGVRPFAAATPVASVLSRMSGPPSQSPRALVPDIPENWDAVIMRCLDPLPEKRFEDAASMVAALKTGEGISRPRWRRRMAAALAAGLLVCTVGGTLAWSELKPRPNAAASRVNRTLDAVQLPIVAVLGFRNLSGREDAQWLSLALSEMLTTELAANEGLRTVLGANVDRMKMKLALADADSFEAETVRRTKQNLGTDFIVFGSYVTIGDGRDVRLRVDIRLQDSRDGRIVAVFGEIGKAADILDIVSRAGGRLRERLGIELTPDSIASIRPSETASPEAARPYAEGLVGLRRFDAIATRELVERAIQTDPKFVLRTPH
jgi:TolB-like protein/tRNA A-37 threonylcarbamoyl transferase component Bud32